MRVDLSPRLGGHTVANQPPPTTVLLSFTFILPPSSPERCKVSQQVWNNELNLNLRLSTVTFLIRLQGPNDSLH